MIALIIIRHQVGVTFSNNLDTVSGMKFGYYKNLVPNTLSIGINNSPKQNILWCFLNEEKPDQRWLYVLAGICTTLYMLNYQTIKNHIQQYQVLISFFKKLVIVSIRVIGKRCLVQTGTDFHAPVKSYPGPRNTNMINSLCSNFSFPSSIAVNKASPKSLVLL